MDIIKIFKILVVVNFIILISFLFLDDQSLTNSNIDLTAAIEESSLSVIDSWSAYAMIAFSLAAIATGPLLFFFVRWSRELLIGILLIVVIVGLVDESNGSYVVITELENLMTHLEALTHGAILAIAYLTPVKDKFK
jgi:hypothetical protein